MLLCNVGHTFDYETEKVVRIFLPYEKINVTNEICAGDSIAVCELKRLDGYNEASAFVRLFGKEYRVSERVSSDRTNADELAVARCLYNALSEITGYKSDWGILTGIRPAKLFSGLSESIGCPAVCSGQHAYSTRWPLPAATTR